MSKLIILGNGFDLGHKLNTRFSNFIESNEDYKTKYRQLKRGDNNWNEIEAQFKELVSNEVEENNTVDVLEEVDQIINGYGLNDYGEVNYYGYTSEMFKDEISKIKRWVNLIRNFEKDFNLYLIRHYSDDRISTLKPIDKIKKLLSSADKIVNFNYTNIVEVVYGVTDVFHIHGDINGKIIIGSDYFNRIDNSIVDVNYPRITGFEKSKHGLIDMLGYYEYTPEGNLMEKGFTKRFFDDVGTEILKDEDVLLSVLKMRSKDCLPERTEFIQNLSTESYDEVYIIGHSLGEADWSVFDALGKCNNIICYYHDEKDYSEKKLIIQKKGWNIKLISDANIFS